MKISVREERILKVGGYPQPEGQRYEPVIPAQALLAPTLSYISDVKTFLTHYIIMRSGE